MESCSPCSVYLTSGINQNVWNICTRRHSCHSKTLSCEQPAASHYAKSNKTVELSLVSQSNISKYSLTTHIGGDLEVCLCVDIEDNGRGNYWHEIPCLQREQSKQLPKPQIHQIWRNTRKCFCMIHNGDVHLCVCFVCVLCIRSSDLHCSSVSACMKSYSSWSLWNKNNINVHFKWTCSCFPGSSIRWYQLCHVCTQVTRAMMIDDTCSQTLRLSDMIVFGLKVVRQCPPMVPLCCAPRVRQLLSPLTRWLVKWWITNKSLRPLKTTNKKQRGQLRYRRTSVYILYLCINDLFFTL